MSATSEYLEDVHRDTISESSHEDVVVVPASRLCAAVSECDVICCLTEYVPEQLHLALGADETQMTVSWVTYKRLSNPAVYFWEANKHENLTIRGMNAAVSTYTAGGWLGTIYNVTLKNLEAGTTYRYRLSGANDKNQNPEFIERVFTTPIAASSEPLAPRSLKAKTVPYVPGTSASVIAFYGDMSTAEAAQETSNALATLAANRTLQLVVQGGDLSYANGNETIWDEYMRQTQQFCSQVPIMVAPGNHENYYHFASYDSRFFMPWTASGSRSKQYYSFNHEKIHFVSWSIEELDGADLLPLGRQRRWLEADLAQANLERDVRPWVVLCGHRPLYCSSDSSDCTSLAIKLRDLIEGLVNKYHVDVVLQAHKHNYERSYPVYKSVPTQMDYEDPEAPMYYVVGTAGRGKNDDFLSPPEWSAHQDDTYGFLLMSAPDQFSLEMVYLSKSFHVHDSATITRSTNITNWTFSH
jgi:acid phosphatase type 7